MKQKVVFLFICVFLAIPFFSAWGKETGDQKLKLKNLVSKEVSRVHSIVEETGKVKPVPRGIGRWIGNFISFLGLFVLLGLAYLMSIHRKNFNKRLIGWGIALQVIFAVLILHTGPGKWIFHEARTAVDGIIGFTNAGAGFVLGVLNNRPVMDKMVQSRVQVFLDSEGNLYVDGKRQLIRDYAPYVFSLSPKARPTATPSDWPKNWAKLWKDPSNPKQLKIPLEWQKKPVVGISYPTAYQYGNWVAGRKYPSRGFIFVFQILTTIIFFSSLMSVLYHLGIMQFVVYWMAKAMAKTMGTSGAESLSVATNVFVGQTEAPLVVKPYVSKMTKSELMALMTGGFATIAGGVLVAYASFGIPVGHLLAASVMSAPAALVMAKIVVPETEHSLTAGKLEMDVEKDSANVIDAAASGASQGMTLALNVAAMLLAFIALIAMMDSLLSFIYQSHNALMAKIGLSNYTSLLPKNLAQLFGYLFYPVAFVMGVPLSDCFRFASLIGDKIAVNEFVAYLHLKDLMPKDLLDTHGISTRAFTIATYALCGFANFGSIAIQLGGIGGIAPERRHDLAKLGLRAMFAGALASFMTATIAGVLLPSTSCDWRYGVTLADKQIKTFIKEDELYALAEFAKPFYQYSLKYPQEDEADIQEAVKTRLARILSHFQGEGEKGMEKGLVFVHIFKRRYPMFQQEIREVLADMAKNPGNKEFIQFVQQF
ncbi:MAG: hypothetical protein D6785_01825 [Planctomycetota bacterium]|nr:MAG: hypothetical protein D6785_01825 [Planctomycetota bacterium]